jgi:hypothetical protein
MLYDDHGLAAEFHLLGTSQQAILDALQRRGVRLPEASPPTYQPWRGHRRVVVAEDDLKPLLAVLERRHPPGSDWRWGFNWLHGEPRRAHVDTEEGIDLDAAVREAQVRTIP